jgi:hypothetical protein
MEGEERSYNPKETNLNSRLAHQPQSRCAGANAKSSALRNGPPMDKSDTYHQTILRESVYSDDKEDATEN